MNKMVLSNKKVLTSFLMLLGLMVSTVKSYANLNKDATKQDRVLVVLSPQSRADREITILQSQFEKFSGLPIARQREILQSWVIDYLLLSVLQEKVPLTVEETNQRIEERLQQVLIEMKIPSLAELDAQMKAQELPNPRAISVAQLRIKYEIDMKLMMYAARQLQRSKDEQKLLEPHTLQVVSFAISEDCKKDAACVKAVEARARAYRQSYILTKEHKGLKADFGPQPMDCVTYAAELRNEINPPLLKEAWMNENLPQASELFEDKRGVGFLIIDRSKTCEPTKNYQEDLIVLAIQKVSEIRQALLVEVIKKSPYAIRILEPRFATILDDLLLLVR